MLPHRRDCPASSDASKYEAHWRRTSCVGPFSKVRNVPFGATYSAKPPGKYGLPVTLASTSAPARLNVLWPEIHAGNAGVTNVRRWYVIQSTARTHPTPDT